MAFISKSEEKRVTAGQRAKAERLLAERKANKPQQIDNSSLYAGSPMYFYCRECGHESDVKSEDYTDTPRRYCRPCQEMIDKGWLKA